MGRYRHIIHVFTSQPSKSLGSINIVSYKLKYIRIIPVTQCLDPVCFLLNNTGHIGEWCVQFKCILLEPVYVQELL